MPSASASAGAPGPSPRTSTARKAIRRSRARICYSRSAASRTRTIWGSRPPASRATSADYIVVNDRLETNVPGIWALGECNGKGAFTHTAYNDFEIVAANLLDGATRSVSERIPAYALYIDPPLGRAGVTEAEARHRGHTILVGQRPMTRVGRAIEKGETNGLMKIVVDAQSQEILGAAVFGTGGDEAIHCVLDTMYAKAPYPVLQTRDAHPSDGLGAHSDDSRRARASGIVTVTRLGSRRARLGSTDLIVSRMGLGLAALGRPAYINLGRQPDLGSDRSVAELERRCHEMLDAAYAAGIRYFDAARSYGMAENFLGTWLNARHPPRDAITVGSKWGYTYVGSWRLDAAVHEVKDLSVDTLRRQIVESRSLLGDRLQLYEIHSATIESKVLENVDVLRELLAVAFQRTRHRIDGQRAEPGGRDPAEPCEVSVDGVNPFQVVQATWNLLERSAAGAWPRRRLAGGA